MELVDKLLVECYYKFMTETVNRYWTKIKGGEFPELVEVLENTFDEWASHGDNLYSFVVRDEGNEMRVQHVFRHAIYDAEVDKSDLVWVAPLKVGADHSKWATPQIIDYATRVESSFTV